MQINPLVLIEAISKLEDDFKGFTASLPAIQGKVHEWLAVEMAKLDSRNRLENVEAVKGQCAAIRVEAVQLAERLMGAVLAKRQEVVGLADLTPTLQELAKGAAHSAFLEYGRRHRNELSDTVKKELAALPVITQPSELFSMAASFTGNWDKDRLYERDEIFTFRGSSYLVLRKCRGILPTQESQKGPKAYYGLIAAAGAPGPSSPVPFNTTFGPTSSTDNAAALWSGTTGTLLKNSVTIINPTTGAISGFTTGIGLTLHGGGVITGASGAISVTASGAGKNVTLTAGDATGFVKSVFGTGSMSAGFVSSAWGIYLLASGTAPAITNWTLANGGGNVFFNAEGYFDWSYQNGNPLMRLSAAGGLNIGTGYATDPGVGSLKLSGVYIGSTQALSGPGAADVAVETTKITSTGVNDAISLANGVNGQVKTVMHDVDGGSFILTPTTRNNWSSFTSTAAGESITMKYVTTRGWTVVGNYLGVIAP